MTKRPKIAKARGRSVPEWIGKTPDSKPPPHVVLRIFDRNDGKCHITQAKINPGDKWDVEHVIRVEDGGENRESNMKPALNAEHLKKTGEENSRGAKEKRVRIAHIGAKEPPKQKIQNRGFPTRDKPRMEKPPQLPRRDPFTHQIIEGS